MEIEKRIINIAMQNGANLAGIAAMESLKVSASHIIYPRMGDYSGIGTVKNDDVFSDGMLFNWPDAAKSLLVIGLSHPEDKPELDWWDGKGTPGNRMLMDILKRTAPRIEDKLKIKTRKLHYYVEKGGVFLKDAAVLAGFGCIGKNNMLLTPSFGPRIRLRALLLDAEVTSTGPIIFDPCADCRVFCRRVCTEKAMNEKAPIFRSMMVAGHLPGRDGAYNRDLCNMRMEKDVAESPKNNPDKPEQFVIKYCRKCEFICPAGKKDERK